MAEKKQYFMEVAGYIRHDVFKQVEEHFDKFGAHELHIYPYNSEGFQLFAISNMPMDRDYVGTIMCEALEADIQPNGMENLLPTEPREFTCMGKVYHHIGWVHGYEHDSVSPTDDKYEV